ncbi:unnamed protein product [Ilex paraguariensis]|uniref:Uncharacterized protein n=1 Tax=Ilex paraguariensis TaxID=185542 RepID=A0ABC8SD19_9AQUA
MDLLSKSFRLERGSSLKRLGRSNSSHLASELAFSSEIARITAYERLSQSMRFTGESSGSRRRKNRALVLLSKIFCWKKIGGDEKKGQGAVETRAKPTTQVVPEESDMKKKRQSSWLPGPHRRWPVQGR